MTQYCKIEIYAPANALEEIANALHSAGAGRAGNYDRTLSYSPVRGRFRPLIGATPHVGEIGKTADVEELKIEVLCEQEKVVETIAAIRAAHPYEVPMIYVVPLLFTGLEQG